MVNLLSKGVTPSLLASFPTTRLFFFFGRKKAAEWDHWNVLESFFVLSSLVGKDSDRTLLECVKPCSRGFPNSRESLRTQIVSWGMFCPYRLFRGLFFQLLGLICVYWNTGNICPESASDWCRPCEWCQQYHKHIWTWTCACTWERKFTYTWLDMQTFILQFKLYFFDISVKICMNPYDYLKNLKKRDWKMSFVWHCINLIKS